MDISNFFKGKVNSSAWDYKIEILESNELYTRSSYLKNSVPDIDVFHLHVSNEAVLEPMDNFYYDISDRQTNNQIVKMVYIYDRPLNMKLLSHIMKRKPYPEKMLAVANIEPAEKDKGIVYSTIVKFFNLLKHPSLRELNLFKSKNRIRQDKWYVYELFERMDKDGLNYLEDGKLGDKVINWLNNITPDYILVNGEI